MSSLATVIMMYSSILSLICTVWILLVPCAARVIVRDTEAVSGALWAPTVHDRIIPNKVRAVLNAAEARSTPANSALWQLSVHEKVSPSRARAVDRRASEPQQTFVSGVRQPTIHESADSRQPVVERTENPVGGFLFADAVRNKISDS